jgi:hypothetical protein
MILNFFITIAILEFFACIFLTRCIWFLVLYGAYCQLVMEFLQDKNATREIYNDYYKTWPFGSIMTRFWDFRLRNFIVNQDLFDEVIKFAINKNERNNN